MDKYSKEAEAMYDSEAKSMDSVNREKVYVKAYKKVINRIALNNFDKILDVGCGTGKLAISFRNIPKKYVGIDLAEKTINIAKKNRFQNQEFFKADMLNMKFDNCSFSKIVALTSIDQVYERELALNECKRVLADDGLLYIEVRNKNYIVKKYLKKLLPVFNIIGITKPMPISDFEDLTYEEWICLFKKCGLSIENQFISARPFYGETVIEKIRHALIEICKYLMPKRHQYMLAFSLKKEK